MELTILKNTYSVYRFTKGEKLPSWIYKSDFYSVTGTSHELSVVAIENPISGAQSEEGWKIFRITGPLAFTVTGIIAGISGLLAGENISIFVLSTYDTDYFMVKEKDLQRCIAALKKKDHKILMEE